MRLPPPASARRSQCAPADSAAGPADTDWPGSGRDGADHGGGDGGRGTAGGAINVITKAPTPQNFYAMTEQLLDQHLDAFWQQLQRPVVPVNAMAHNQALALLDLPAAFTPQQLKKAYRTKALQLHPDRGGEQQQFILLQQAYQQLQLPG